MDYIFESAVLKALGHPVRLKIVDGLLSGKECNVNTMVKNLKLPQSTVSQHLGILKNSGIISYKKDGVSTCYRVVNDNVKKIIAILNKKELYEKSI